MCVDQIPYKKFLHNNLPKQNIYIVEDEKTEPLSSIDIRKSYYNNQKENIKKITFPKVAVMIINFYKENFIINKIS